MTATVRLQSEIELARHARVPVLISASHASARALVLAITERLTPGGDADLVVWEVHALTEVQQAALLKTIVDGELTGRLRVIATSSACLLDLVSRGTFSETLFYRLNAIHIVTDSCREVGEARGPERLDKRERLATAAWDHH